MLPLAFIKVPLFQIRKRIKRVYVTNCSASTVKLAGPQIHPRLICMLGPVRTASPDFGTLSSSQSAWQVKIAVLMLWKWRVHLGARPQVLPFRSSSRYSKTVQNGQLGRQARTCSSRITVMTEIRVQPSCLLGGAQAPSSHSCLVSILSPSPFFLGVLSHAVKL